MFENHSKLKSLGAIELYVEVKIVDNEVNGGDDEQDGDEQCVDASGICSIPTSYPPYSQEGIEAEPYYQPELGSYGFQHNLASSSQARIPESGPVTSCNNLWLGSNVQTMPVCEGGGSERIIEQPNIRGCNSPIDPILETSDDEDAEYVPDEEESGGEDEYEQVLDLNVAPLGEEVQHVTPIQLVLPPYYSYVNLEALQQTDILEEGSGVNRWQRGEELQIGQQFTSKENLQSTVKQYAIYTHHNFRVKESKPDKLILECNNYGSGCNWRLRACLRSKSNMWEIRKYNGPHSCTNATLTQDHKQLDVKVVTTFIVSMIEEKADVPIKLIQERIRNKFSYQISYRKAWLAKQRAIARIYGDWEESYNKLPRWMAALQRYAPETIVEWCMDDRWMGRPADDPTLRRFRRVFWAFKPCIDAFRWCKPVIQIDGTFLYGKYKQTLLIATTQDGSRSPLPLAYAVVEGETKEAWSWFLKYLRQHVAKNMEDLALISDRHVSILSSIEDVDVGWRPPLAHNFFCLRHVVSNWNTNFKDVALKHKIYRAGAQFESIKFEELMTDIHAECQKEDAWQYINGIDKAKWTQQGDIQGRRYGLMTTNLAKCVNGTLKGARNMPITALVRAKYYRMNRIFLERREMARARLASGQAWTEDAQKRMTRNSRYASSHRPILFNRDNGSFEVEELFDSTGHINGRSFALNLKDSKCACGQFQALHIPCTHAISACASIAIDAWKYVSPVYSTESLIRAYSGEFHPIGGEDCWPILGGIKVIPNRGLLRAKGRPVSRRIRNEMDWGESSSGVIRCSICRMEGHNRRRCPNRRQDQP